MRSYQIISTRMIWWAFQWIHFLRWVGICLELTGSFLWVFLSQSEYLFIDLLHLNEAKNPPQHVPWESRVAARLRKSTLRIYLVGSWRGIYPCVTCLGSSTTCGPPFLTITHHKRFGLFYNDVYCVQIPAIGKSRDYRISDSFMRVCGKETSWG